mmetsp:Transcript_46479/g.122032  ORF Transcript_46479/g.122032 Transcript_46479/m.122032 type:complete len:210 (+) Transcript_46479:816-1445(+)
MRSSLRVKMQQSSAYCALARSAHSCCLERSLGKKRTDSCCARGRKSSSSTTQHSEFSRTSSSDRRAFRFGRAVPKPGGEDTAGLEGDPISARPASCVAASRATAVSSQPASAPLGLSRCTSARNAATLGSGAARMRAAALSNSSSRTRGSVERRPAPECCRATSSTSSRASPDRGLLIDPRITAISLAERRRRAASLGESPSLDFLKAV